MRRKTLACAELLDDLERSEAAHPYRDGDLEWIVAVVGRDRAGLQNSSVPTAE